jgi:o-succinylbenzoate synthase
MPDYQLNFMRHTLQFKFDARTSRGAISEHTVYYISLWNKQEPEVSGIGECAPLAGLSIDYRPDLEQKLQQVCRLVNQHEVPLLNEAGSINAAGLDLEAWPALQFALETAILDFNRGGKRVLFDNAFSRGEQGVPINGLIWMGDKDFMQEQIRKKLGEGYTCLKLKIGGLDFATELDILQSIREVAGPGELTIRVDANGAFKPEDAFRKLERLARYDLHSIEQPIKQGQRAQMEQLCAYSPIPVALDEELIGVRMYEEQVELLDQVKPPYIILKPTLVGGLQATATWINLAEERNCGWWITSALESNIGLNAISQFTAEYPVNMPQGLGTGQLYHNNIASPLAIADGKLWYRQKQSWEDLPL